MLPTFQVRGFRCYDNEDAPSDATEWADIQLEEQSQYDQLIRRTPEAILSYIDEDDGDVITVGSSLELFDRIEELQPTKPVVFDVLASDDKSRAKAFAAWKRAIDRDDASSEGTIMGDVPPAAQDRGELLIDVSDSRPAIRPQENTREETPGATLAELPQGNAPRHRRSMGDFHRIMSAAAGHPAAEDARPLSWIPGAPWPWPFPGRPFDEQDNDNERGRHGRRHGGRLHRAFPPPPYHGHGHHFHGPPSHEAHRPHHPHEHSHELPDFRCPRGRHGPPGHTSRHGLPGPPPPPPPPHALPRQGPCHRGRGHGPRGFGAHFIDSYFTPPPPFGPGEGPHHIPQVPPPPPPPRFPSPPPPPPHGNLPPPPPPPPGPPEPPVPHFPGHPIGAGPWTHQRNGSFAGFHRRPLDGGAPSVENILNEHEQAAGAHAENAERAQRRAERYRERMREREERMRERLERHTARIEERQRRHAARTEERSGHHHGLRRAHTTIGSSRPDVSSARSMSPARSSTPPGDRTREYSALWEQLDIQAGNVPEQEQGIHSENGSHHFPTLADMQRYLSERDPALVGNLPTNPFSTPRAPSPENTSSAPAPAVEDAPEVVEAEHESQRTASPPPYPSSSSAPDPPEEEIPLLPQSRADPNPTGPAAGGAWPHPARAAWDFIEPMLNPLAQSASHPQSRQAFQRRFPPFAGPSWLPANLSRSHTMPGRFPDADAADRNSMSGDDSDGSGRGNGLGSGNVGVDECVAQLVDMGFADHDGGNGHEGDNVERLMVVAQICGGDVLSAVEMLEEERRAWACV